MRDLPIMPKITAATSGDDPTIFCFRYCGGRSHRRLHDVLMTLNDLATLNGATVISQQTGRTFEHATLVDPGTACHVEIARDTTTIVEARGERHRLEERTAALRTRVASLGPGSERDALSRRLMRPADGVAVIRVGTATETALHERKNRFEDALHATRSALKEGILPGGGVALPRARTVREAFGTDETASASAKIVHDALATPVGQIADNVGADAQVVMHTVSAAQDASGYNAASCTFVDMLAAGIVNLLKVARMALQNAASIASLLLTTDCTIACQAGTAYEQTE
jgi:chaperonin GroEL